MNLHQGFSENGIDWRLDNDPIDWQCADPEIGRFWFRYDPRVVWPEDRYYITWCTGYHGPTIRLGRSEDFERFTLRVDAPQALRLDDDIFSLFVALPATDRSQE